MQTFSWRSLVAAFAASLCLLTTTAKAIDIPGVPPGSQPWGVVFDPEGRTYIVYSAQQAYQVGRTLMQNGAGMVSVMSWAAWQAAIGQAFAPIALLSMDVLLPVACVAGPVLLVGGAAYCVWQNPSLLEGQTWNGDVPVGVLGCTQSYDADGNTYQSCLSKF